MGDATGKPDAEPGVREVREGSGSDPGTSDMIGDPDMAPGFGDEIGDVDRNFTTDPGGNTIGDEGTEPGMVKIGHCDAD